MSNKKKQNANNLEVSKAILKYARLSPIKARLIAREIQGMNGENALASLEFTSNKAAKFIYKTLASAIANGGYEASSVEVVSCRIDSGPVLKRFTPRARGRATPIRKPMSHILVEVAEVKKMEKKLESNKTKKIRKNKDEVK